MRNRLSIITMALVAVSFLFSSCTQKHYQLGIFDFEYAPFTNIGENNVPEGICIDIIEAIAKEQGFTYDLKPYSLQDLFDAISEGEVDGVVAPITATQENRLRFDCTYPFFETGLVFVKNPDNGKIREIKDLEGKKAVVLENTNIERYLKAHNDLWQLAKIETRSSNDAIIEDLMYDKADVAIMEKPLIEYHIAQGLMLEVLPGMLDKSTFVNLVNKGQNEQLYNDLNIGFAKIINNGTYKKILAKYYL